MINAKYVRKLGPERDGLGLYEYAWATGYHKPESKDSQRALKKQLRDFRVADGVSTYDLVLSLNTILQVWLLVLGNDPSKYKAFWDLVVESMHSDPKSSIGVIRIHVATRLIDKPSLVDDPARFIH